MCWTLVVYQYIQHFRACDSENGGLDVKQVDSHLTSPNLSISSSVTFPNQSFHRKISTPVCCTPPPLHRKPCPYNASSCENPAVGKFASFLHHSLIINSAPSLLSSKLGALGNEQQAFTPCPTPYPPSTPAPGWPSPSHHPEKDFRPGPRSSALSYVMWKKSIIISNCALLKIERGDTNKQQNIRKLVKVLPSVHDTALGTQITQIPEKLPLGLIKILLDVIG